MKKKLKYDIICFAPNDWWGMNPSCATHYMLHFSKHTKVLYINPFSSDMTGINKGLYRRIPRKVKSILRFLREPKKNLFVFSPIFLPFQGVKAFDTINNFFLKIQIRSVLKILGIRKPLIWLENPRAVDMLDFIEYTKILYHVSDHFTKTRYIKNKEPLEQRENKATQKSDLVITVSKSLYAWKKHHPNMKYLPHGVDFDLFRHAVENKLALESLKNIAKPIIGYYGTLSSSNDIDMWTYCAKKLSKYSFVFAGKVTGGDYSQLFSLSNVFHLGMLPYEKIPYLCAAFDVCMLQWKMTDWIAACNPLKTMEYMASGKPIVSVPIKYIQENYSDVISIAETKEEFSEAIQWELKNDTSQRSAKRVKIARDHSWESNFEKINLWIDKLLSDDV